MTNAPLHALVNPPERTAIREIVAWEVIVPARNEVIDSPGLGQFMSGVPWDRLPIVLLQILSDDGIVSLGEVSRGVKISSLNDEIRQLIGRPFGGPGLTWIPESLRGEPLWGLSWEHPPALWQSRSALTGALELASLDWAGKRLGCSGADVLGGAYVDKVLCDYWCGRQTPQDLARLVSRARDRGFKGLKMKARLGDPLADQLTAIRDSAGPGFRVTIDPMFQWQSYSHAASMFAAVEKVSDLNIRIEDPFPQDRPDEWRRARNASGIPLVWHARGIDPLRRGLVEACSDQFNCSGGIREFLTCASALEVTGQSCWHGTAIELGIAQAGHLHAAAAARSCTLPGDFVSGFVREHTCVDWNWPYHEGHLPLPPGPGLGVSLDVNAVSKYTIATARYV
jgi:muconate cycloisomerase